MCRPKSRTSQDEKELVGEIRNAWSKPGESKKDLSVVRTPGPSNSFLKPSVANFESAQLVLAVEMIKTCMPCVAC